MTTQKAIMSQTAITRMEKNLNALLAESKVNQAASALGQLGAYSAAAVEAGITGNREKCDCFAKAHFDAEGIRLGKPVAQPRISEWTRAMEFGDKFKTVETLTMHMVEALRQREIKCHIHNTANSVFTLYAKSKKENTPEPTIKDMDSKIAARVTSHGVNKAKRDKKDAEFALLDTPAQLASKIDSDKRIDTIKGILEAMHAEGYAGTEPLIAGLANLIKVEPETVAPETPAPETPAGDADLASIMEARMDSKFDALAALLVDKLGK